MTATTNEDSAADTETSEDIVEMFALEAADQLDALESLLLGIESNASDTTLNEAFRAMHSVKGNAGCLGLSDIEAVAHRAEDILDGFRKRVFPPQPKLVSSVLAAVDAIRRALRDPEGGGAIADRGVLLTRMQDDLVASNPSSAVPRLGEILVASGAVASAQVDEIVDFQRRPIGELLVTLGLVGDEQVDDALATQRRIADGAPAAAPSEPGARPSDPAVDDPKAARAEASFVRVDTTKLDALLGQVGELISAVSAVVQCPEVADLDLDLFTTASAQLTRVTSGLHDAAMAMRMVPLAGVVNKLNRVVRDLRIKLGKRVTFVAEGEQTEVDKSVLEGVADPLVHIVRNALDHGMESPTARVAAGKPETGTIRLHARHQGGEVWISVSDDGRGIDPARLRAKAEALGWLAPDATISDASLLQLVFRPGFSTAEAVTGVSGRGVGMDVVKHNIEALRGRVEIASTPGVGTTVSIRLPLTLAIIDVMLVRVAGCLFGLPVLSLRESVSVPEGAVTVLPDGATLVRIRERILPVVGLEQVFRFGPTRSPTQGLVAVVEHGEKVAGLRVDHLLGQRQVVIKPLDPYVAGRRGVSGCAVLGTGEVCLIVDIGQLLDGDELGHREVA
jgi:two-component system chemotaxis sensor kinase CheA